MTKSTLVYISLGSNINPQDNTRRAITTLTSRLKHCRTSGIYRSPAVGMQGADFLNAVIGGTTGESLPQVVQWLHDIEHSHGRVRSTQKFIDRPLDLDLLLYGEQIAQGIPHHDIAEQAYVLQPLTDIAPSLIHPVLKLSVRELKARLISQSPDKFAALTPVTLLTTQFDHHQPPASDR